MSEIRRKIKPLSELNLSDDYMFGKVMRVDSICKMFLEALLKISIEKIEYLNTQEVVDETYSAHGIRMDVYVKDAQGSVYNIEMQREDNKDLPRRIRYIQSSLDRLTLSKGEDYKNLRESYVIFICDFDAFGRGLAICERTSSFAGTNVPYNDGSHVLLLNSRYTIANASDEVCEFLTLVRETDTLDVLSTALAKETKKKVWQIRGDKRLEDDYMSYEWRFQEGANQMLQKNILAVMDILSASEIAKRFQVPEIYVRSIIKDAQAASNPRNKSSLSRLEYEKDLNQ